MSTNTPDDGKIVHDPDLRSGIYTTVIAIGALLVGYGFITSEEAQLWINLAVAVTAIGSTVLARFNVTKKG